MKCRHCKTPLETQVKFCSQCGKKDPVESGLKCRECGKSLKETDRFCTECGAPVTQKTPTCKCGAETVPGDKFCGGCGERLESPAKVPPGDTTSHEDGGRHVEPSDQTVTSAASQDTDHGTSNVKENETGQKQEHGTQAKDVPTETNSKTAHENPEQAQAAEDQSDAAPQDTLTEEKVAGPAGASHSQAAARPQEDKVGEETAKPVPVDDDRNTGNETHREEQKKKATAQSAVDSSDSEEEFHDTKSSQSETVVKHEDGIEKNDTAHLQSEDEAHTESTPEASGEHPDAGKRPQSERQAEKNDTAHLQSEGEAQTESTPEAAGEHPDAGKQPPHERQAEKKDTTQLQPEDEAQTESTPEAGEHPDAGKQPQRERQAGAPSADTMTRHSSSKQHKQQKQQQKQQSEARHSERNRNKQTVTVCFNVVVSKQVNNCSDVTVVISRPGEGETHSTDCTEIGKNDSGTLFQLKMELPVKAQRPVDFTYSYTVKRSKKDKSFSDQSKRPLVIPPGQELQHGLIQVYDFVSKPPPGFMRYYLPKKLGGKETFDEVGATALLLPTPSDVLQSIYQQSAGSRDLYPADRFLREVQRIKTCLTPSQCTDANFKESVKKHMIEPLRTAMENSQRRTVALAMFLLLLSDMVDACQDIQFLTLLFSKLLVKPGTERKTCGDLADLQHHFTCGSKYMLDTILHYLPRVVHGANGCSWICAMPLVHFLSGKVQPFTEPEPSPDHRQPEWWGTEHIEVVIEKMKSNQTAGWRVPRCTTEDILEMNTTLSDAFIADPLMLKTFPATLILPNLVRALKARQFPVSVILASVFYYTRTDQRQVQSVIKDIIDILKAAQAQTTESGNTRDQAELDVPVWKCSAAIGLDILSEVMQTFPSEHDLLAALIRLQLAVLDRCSQVEIKPESESVQSKNIKDNTFALIRRWMEKSVLQSKMFEEVVQCLLLTKDLHSFVLVAQARRWFSGYIVYHIDKMPMNQKIDTCVRILESQVVNDSETQRKLLNVLEAALEKSEHMTHGNRKERLAICHQLSPRFESDFNNINEDGLLQFVFTWKLMAFFLQAQREEFNDSTRQILDQVQTYVETLATQLIDGSVTVWKVDWLEDHRDQLAAVTNAAGGDGVRAVQALDLRIKELMVFRKTVDTMPLLLEFSDRHLQTNDLNHVKEEVKRNSDIRDQPIARLCQRCADPGEVSPEHYEPLPILTGVPDAFKSNLLILEHRMMSKIFCNILRELTTGFIEGDSYWQVVSDIWTRGEAQWKTVCASVKSGDITLLETGTLFNFVEQGVDMSQVCMEELMKMEEVSDRPWVRERVEQIVCLKTMQTQRDTAVRLLELKQEFSLAGDLTDISSFLEEDMSQRLRNLRPTVLEISHALQSVSGRHIMNLQQFGSDRCRTFVEWIRETMGGGGQRDIKVFVDLALNYVGDNPHGMDKVRNFQAVIEGYAPIFFEFSEDHTTFLERWRKVCTNIETDESLPDKLESTVSLLSWFDEIRNYHGSVEKTALGQVDNIISRGILRMGKVVKKKRKGTDIELSDVIVLDLPSDDSGPMRTYSHSDLVDLQSRLMLVAGHAERGRDNLDKFVSVMESIERVAQTYIQVCRDGCLLFHNWAVKFFFDEERPVCCIAEFFQSDEQTKQQLKGMRRGLEGESGRTNSTIEDYISEVASFLETCRDSWLKYVDKKRKDYEELNLYTMDQLVFLQEQLLHLNDDSVSPHLFAMLSLLRSECSKSDVVDAIQKAAKYEMECEEENVDEEDDVRVAVQFIQHMTENGFSKQLASRALKHVENPRNLEEGIEWCLDNPGEADLIEDDADEAGVQTLLTRQGTIANALKFLEKQGPEDGMTIVCMAEQLGAVWTTFLQTVKFSGEDCLSLLHLGLVLKHLGEQCDHALYRHLPEYMKPGRPHLLVCSSREVLNTLTSLYMVTDSAPLPQPDEVLLCRQETTLEQVDIFLRRVFTESAEKKGKLHCLAFADRLDYTVSEKAEKMLTERVHTAKCAFQLVVICTAESEFNAHMTAALEKYLTQWAPVGSDKVLDYLRDKFASTDDKESAAFVDPERSSVRVVKSSRAGMGKTLYKKRQVAKLRQKLGAAGDTEICVTVPLYTKEVNIERVAETLLCHISNATVPRVIHLDISYEVQEGVDILLYNLLVLGCIMDIHGHVWRRSASDYYLVEAMPLLEHTKTQEQSNRLMHQIFDVLPSITCWSPYAVTDFYQNKNLSAKGPHDQLFDQEEARSQVFQRPFLCLRDLDSGKQPRLLTAGSPSQDDNSSDCLSTLLRHCGLTNPSWSELYQFASFLNKQLLDFQKSLYCSKEYAADLPGFAAFVLRFLIHMSKDFSTRSLVVAEEEIPAFQETVQQNDIDLEQFQMRRTWESSPHPYIFFNPDQTTMTFLGFTVDEKTKNLRDARTNVVLEKHIMSNVLYRQLVLAGVPLEDKFDLLGRDERLQRLYQVMGVPDSEMRNGEEVIDPDDTYELTTDNVKKIMAIYMRFRCNIPVIIMGETGCGKTRLVKFLCDLQAPSHPDICTMVLVKVHGGTTTEQIHRKVREAEERAEKVCQKVRGREVFTVLFFDEANTTEAIGAIKEVMCDGCMNGVPIKLHKNLKMVAACNPYRKHEPEVIQRLEKAGLGYHVSAEETNDRLGRLPMRQLVYRVRPLPQSMLPLVWDFGQLSDDVEEKYIVQMVRRFKGKLGDLAERQVQLICNLLVMCQKTMRELKDECSFVSLRDAERSLTVASWFLQQQDLLLQTKAALQEDVDFLSMSLVLALGICYRAGLRSKRTFDKKVVPLFGKSATDAVVMPLDLFSEILSSCQEVLLNNVTLGEKIAGNQALKENIFMMVVCVELCIPLFLVGKPGSSKSLAKSIVADAMQGAHSSGTLFHNLKETQMVSFQCSPIATADGVISTFRQCAHIQLGKDREKFIAVAVLDEIGLAEDSPKMPLKALHPLLEEGCEVEMTNGAEEGKGNLAENVKLKAVKVAFIGISNWALDPAKMNRGILVQREVPDEKELVETAKGICLSGKEEILGFVDSLLESLARAYLNTFETAINLRREFFGLRDFYSLVKMIHAKAAAENRKLNRAEFRAAIRRNFGGLQLESFDPVHTFEDVLRVSDLDSSHGQEVPYSALLLAALHKDECGGESRYLLLLTENYGGLRILTDNLLSGRDIVPIFGSSFPKDQEYTQICCNINHIKVCMETGKTVVLLNLENLYESLYDALNQYYSTLAGARYVNLGLGSHRVKCKVDENFRLIVVAEKKSVYEKFPIPLINRLEKHFLTVSNLLNDEQRQLKDELHDWIKTLSDTRDGSTHFNEGEVLVGYHPDTPASIILMAWEKHLGHGEQTLTPEAREKILEEGRDTLLWCATPDSIVCTQDAALSQWYFEKQQHDDFAQYLKAQLQKSQGTSFLAQVTTHSKKLTNNEKEQIEQQLVDTSVILLSLQSFSTEQQYQQQLSKFLRGNDKDRHRVLLIQCERGDENQQLLQCAQYKLQKMWSEIAQPKHHAVFIVQLPRVSSAAFSGFMGGKWHCAHVDDLRTSAFPLPTVPELQSCSPAKLLSADRQENTQMDVGGSFFSVQTAGFHDELVQHLLVKQVQEAVARLRDRDDTSSRSMHRIAILKRSLETMNEDSRFFTGIRRMLAVVFMEQEEQQNDAQDWLADDAAKPECIRRSGTFRRAWLMCLELRIVPALAGIVAFLDTDNNLDLLEKEGWMQQLWLKILNDPDVCQLHYTDLLSMSGSRAALREFACNSTFQAKDATGCSFPFFWILREQIEKCQIGTSLDEAVTPHHEAGDNYTQSFDNTSLGHHVQDVLRTQEDADQFLRQYTSDLLYAYFPVTTGEHGVLLLCMQSALQQMGIAARTSGMGEILIQVHQSLSCVEPRLQSVLDMLACCPEALQESCPKEHDANLPPENEMTRDVLILEILVKKLTPHKHQLNKDEGCQEWTDLFNRFAPVILRVLSDIDSTTEEGEGCHRNQTLQYSDWCKEQLVNIRCLWTKLAAVKLFMDYMNPLDLDGQSYLVPGKKVNYTLLLTLLGDKANLKTKKSLQSVDKFLRNANKQMVTHYLGDVGKCGHCKNEFSQPPVQLLCQHRMCEKCFTQEVAINHMCPECHKDVPQDFDKESGDDFNMSGTEKLESYMKQSSGFLMALVSQLCFAGHAPPDPDAVQHIFGYVIQKVEGATVRTRNLTLREDQIDPTPVLRSFLLHLLLQHSEVEVTEHITEFLENAKEMIKGQGQSAEQANSLLTELSLLVIYCIENLEREKEATDESRSDQPGEAGFETQCRYVTDLLSSLRHVLDRDDVESCSQELDTLKSLGRLRYALAACARLLHSSFISPAEVQPMARLMTNMCKEAAVICGLGESQWPTKYFIKYLCREFSISAYTTLLERAKNMMHLMWVHLGTIEKEITVPDRYLVCGENYIKIRSASIKCLVEGQIELLKSALHSTASDSTRLNQYFLLLAFHRGMADNPKDTYAQQQLSEMAKDILRDGGERSTGENFGDRLVSNQLGEPGSYLCLDSGRSLMEQNLTFVLVHFWLALNAGRHQQDLLRPLDALANHPSDMKDSFFPTMPQDEMMEMIEAMNIMGGNHTLWECENGHAYVIGECGRPWTEMKCPECNVVLGGRRHKANEGNRQINLQDNTKPGHILGASEDRSEEVTPQRGNTESTVGLLRFLTHSALYIASVQPALKADVAELVTPRVNVDDLPMFFWSHLHKDLWILSKVFGKSTDDVFILLHHLCHSLALRKSDQAGTLLKTKQERMDWEHSASDTFLQDLLKRSDDIIAKGNDLIVNDTTQGDSQLLKIVFEVGEDSADADYQSLFETPVPWKYRTRITVDGFFRQLYQKQVDQKTSREDNEQCQRTPQGNPVQEERTQAEWPVLNLFHKEDHHLRALYFLPTILFLQRRLMRQLRDRVYRKDVTKSTIQEMKSRKHCEGLSELKDVFSKAWNIVNTSLVGYRCPAVNGKVVQLPEEFHNVAVTDDSPMGMLLPDTQGPGCCAYLLTHYLLVQHNDFLERYCGIPLAKQRYDHLPEVQVSSLSRRHLVGYSPQADLLPLVLAHCSYSLHLGHVGSTASKLEYDFHGFQLQLRNTLFLSKSRVQRESNGSMKIETIAYSADTTYSSLLAQVITKVKQESLQSRTQRQIREDFRDSLPDICQSIDSISTAIAFLLKLKVNPEQLLFTFMTSELKMTSGVQSQKAKQDCRLKHVQALWLLLCQMRAEVLAAHNEEAFDGQGAHIRKELEEEQKQELYNALKRLRVERVELLLAQMFECILLQVLQHTDEESANPDLYSVHWLVCENIENPPYSITDTGATHGSNQVELSTADLDQFPQTVMASQAIPCWLHVYAHLLGRRHQAADVLP